VDFVGGLQVGEPDPGKKLTNTGSKQNSRKSLKNPFPLCNKRKIRDEAFIKNIPVDGKEAVHKHGFERGKKIGGTRAGK